jgi:ABC-type nitrate/sulfonate/bicarbonate transport system substrate-binding protein
MAINLDSLAALYLRGTKSRAGLTAFSKVDKLVKSDPEQAWQFMLRLLARAKNDQELAYIGAGVLEDFLNRHGLMFVGRVDEVWKRDPKMRRAMSSVVLR